MVPELTLYDNLDRWMTHRNKPKKGTVCRHVQSANETRYICNQRNQSKP